MSSLSKLYIIYEILGDAFCPFSKHIFPSKIVTNSDSEISPVRGKNKSLESNRVFLSAFLQIKSLQKSHIA